MLEPSRRQRFEVTVLVHLHAGHNLARWLLRDQHGADDVLQDASLRAFRHFDAIQGPNPKAWFMAIVRNACMDWLASNARRVQEDRFDELIHGGPALDDLGRFESPETLAIRSAEVRRLHACLAALAPEFREVLVLREMEDLSYRDISAVVGVPMGTVMSRLSRGRDQLANAMRSGDRKVGS